MHQLIWIGTASEAPQSRKKCVKLHFKLTGNPTVYSVHIWKVNALGLPEYVCGIDPEEVHARVSEARFQRFPLDMICEKCLGVVATRYQLSTDPKAAYSDEQLCDELANALRNEGFEASKQVVNGEIGVLIGPKGLNPLRMPPGQRAIFFPHQELTDKANRALVARRDFHRICERRQRGKPKLR